MKHAACERGFTLIETLVAMTMLALLFGALLPVFHGGLSALGRGEQQARAVQLAESLLAREVSNVPVRDAGDSALSAATGEQDGYAWTITREPYVANDGGPMPEDASGLMLVRVTALIRWPGGGSEGFHLSTLSLERTR